MVELKFESKGTVVNENGTIMVTTEVKIMTELIDDKYTTYPELYFLKNVDGLHDDEIRVYIPITDGVFELASVIDTNVFRDVMELVGARELSDINRAKNVVWLVKRGKNGAWHPLVLVNVDEHNFFTYYIIAPSVENSHDAQILHDNLTTRKQ